jgi:hypothetical protein
MLKLNYDAVHRFVDGFPNASWDGYTLELFKPTPRGFTNKNGAFRNGQWGLLDRIAPDDKGIWTFRVR